jgi:hypothetical protein
MFHLVPEALGPDPGEILISVIVFLEGSVCLNLQSDNLLPHALLTAKETIVHAIKVADGPNTMHAIAPPGFDTGDTMFSLTVPVARDIWLGVRSNQDGHSGFAAQRAFVDFLGASQPLLRLHVLKAIDTQIIVVKKYAKSVSQKPSPLTDFRTGTGPSEK